MSNRHDVAPTDVATIAAMSSGLVARADQIVTFIRPTLTGKPEVVVELRDGHGNLLARSVLRTDTAADVVADEFLRDAPVERCSAFVVEPLNLKKVRRLVASVCPATNASTSFFEQARRSAAPISI